MIIRNGLRYANNYARAAAYYLSTCAPAPLNKPQLDAYNLITGIYTAVFNDAASLGYKPLPDVCFEPWEQQKGREKDVKNIRQPIDTVEALIKQLFDAVEASQVTEAGLRLAEGYPTFKKALTAALAAAGCEIETRPQMTLKMSRDCALALKQLAAISREHIIPITDGPKEDKAYLFFSRCVFDAELNWTAMAFDSILNADGRLIRLCEELEKRGYERIVCRDGKRISLDYVKQHGKKAEPVKMAWGERTHSGIEISYEDLRLEPCFVWIRMPMYKTVLNCADKLPRDVADFLAANTKTCNGCRYCVQTDKTHTRPVAAVKINGKAKCPLYPGFTMNRRELTPQHITEILAVIDTLNALDELR